MSTSATIGSLGVKVYVGQSQGVTFLGWNLFLGGAVPAEARAALAAWVGDQVGDLDEPPTSSVPRQRSASLVDQRVAHVADGYIPLGTTVSSTAELTELLRNWVSVSSQGTIGDVGDFGKRPWVRVGLGTDLVVLNADTKRSAVLDYLAHAADVGHNPPWYVHANRNGRINKVGYRDDAPPSPGWYAYLVPPADAPRTL